MRRLTLAAVALATLANAAPAVAQPVPAVMPDLTRAYPGEDYAQYRERYYYGRPHYARPHYARPHYDPAPRHYYRRRDSGSAVAAGVAGLAAGALIGSVIASQAQAAPPRPPASVDPQLAAYCARRFRSFDPVTGTYVAYTGERIVCTY